MGRKRLDENEKKMRYTISIKKKYVDELRKKDINVSALIESFVVEWLKKNKNK